MTTYKVYETACHPNKWKVAAALWAKGKFYPSREKAEAEADRLNKIEQYVYGNRKDAEKTRLLAEGVKEEEL